MTMAMLFGKLPAHGDFVSRGIAAAERDLLDLWMAGSMAEAREMLGAGFDAAYDVAPPWRFAWRDADGRWSAGAMAPSVDGVGRRYPIMVGLRGLPAEAVEDATAVADALIYDALSGGWTADRLLDAAASASPQAGGEWTSAPGWWTVDVTGATVTRIDGERPPVLMRTVVTMPVGDAPAAVEVEGGAWA